MEHIRLDLIPGKRPPICHASQYDDGRVVRVDLTENGEDYTLSNEVIVLDVRKGDGCVVTAACAIVSGKKYVDIVLTQQMTAVFGSNLAELQITKDGTLIGTLNFIIEVERDPLDSSIASSSVIHDLQAQVDACVDTALEERGASAVGYDNTTSGLTATNVQEAIDEVNDKIGGGMGDYYTKSETDALLDDKADKSDLNDYYTKSQADILLAGKVDNSDLDNYYTKSEVNSAMSGKADKANVYTKSQTDSLLAGKVDSSELGNYYTTTEVDAALNSKANKSSVYTKSETNSLLNGKVDNSALDNYYTKSQSYSKNEVDTALSGKANSSDVYDKDYMDGIFEEIDNAFTGVNTALGTKADKSTTYTKTEVNTLLSGKVDNATLNNYYTKSEVDKMIYDIYPSKTATGSIANFTTSLALPLVSAKFAIKATGGNGTPSSPIAINGFTGLTVKHSGSDTSDYTSYPISWQTEAGTVYGGEVDVTSGKLKVTHGITDLGDLTWNYNSQYALFYCDAISDCQLNPTTCLCSSYEFNSGANGTSLSQMSNNLTDKQMCAFSNQNNKGRFVINDSTYTDTTAFTTSVTGQKLVYPLATPLEYDLTPQEITALIGTNNIWGDTNGNASVEYKQSIPDAIAEVQALVL